MKCVNLIDVCVRVTGGMEYTGRSIRFCEQLMHKMHNVCAMENAVGRSVSRMLTRAGIVIERRLL